MPLCFIGVRMKGAKVYDGFDTELFQVLHSFFCWLSAPVKPIMYLV